MPNYTLYHTRACHLCDLSEEVMGSLPDTHRLIYQKADIADDDRLITLYGTRIPVLRSHKSGDELGWPFDVDRLKDWLILN